MTESEADQLLKKALQDASDTRAVRLGSGVLSETRSLFEECFGKKPAVIVTDHCTWKAAGHLAHETFAGTHIPIRAPLIFSDPQLYAESKFVTEVENFLRGNDAIPIAVGSGTINDLVKLASHRVGRPYLCVGTAASMDGYTAFGASITHEGSKQTFSCPAPVAVLADLEIIRRAPAGMNAWGYADLVAKITAGADWILADALGAEPIHPGAWNIVQGSLRDFIANPAGIATGDIGNICRLTTGLLLSGFGMQAARSSRPASGAEHQFSHLWDMQHHTHGGQAPSHGFKVAVGTLASTALYGFLFSLSTTDLFSDPQPVRGTVQIEKTLPSLFSDTELLTVARQECRAKIDQAARLDFEAVKAAWQALKTKLQKQLLPLGELESHFSAAGAPTGPEMVGINRARLQRSFLQAFCIRRRYTVLDFAVNLGVLDRALDHLFGAQGPWPIERAPVAAV